MEDLVIVGAGGHGRELFDSLTARNAVSPTWNILGFVDDAPVYPDRVDRLGLAVLGDLRWFSENPCAFALGIGEPMLRRSVLIRLGDVASRCVSVIDPGASVGSDVRLGDGVVVSDRAVITTNVTVGAQSQFSVGAAVQHDSTVGEYVQLDGRALVSGNCTIGDDVVIEAGAVITRGCTIGDGAVIGAGAVVTSDIEAGAVVPTAGR